MPKKCIICGLEAKYVIKDTSDFYCAMCAEEQFGSVDMLIKVEEQAAKLKRLIDEKQKTENNPIDPLCENQ
ncbi:MAG: hypothetical protein QXK37_00565 [Candidatus Woesearchaeota archaeon]